MTTIVFDDFGGLVPRVSATALPPNAATAAGGLLSSSREFRPVKKPTNLVFSGSTRGVANRSLYRFYRDSSGVPNTSDTTGWKYNDADVNFVRGPLNDDSQERSYLSYNDGSAAPQVLDNGGGSRQLGVPRPTVAPAPIVVPPAVAATTTTSASDWVSGTLKAAVIAAIKANLNEDPHTSRWASGNTVAGPTSLMGLTEPTYPTSQRGLSEPWTGLASVSTATAVADGLDDPGLGGVNVAGTTWFAINVAPSWGVINVSALATALAAINKPDGTPLWNSTQATSYANDFGAWFNPARAEVLALRVGIDSALASFMSGLGYATTAPLTPPTDPGPFTGEMYTITNPENGDTAISTAYATWQTNYYAYKAALTAYNANSKTILGQVAQRIAAMKDGQTAAASQVRAVEAFYAGLKGSLDAAVGTYLTNLNLVSAGSGTSGGTTGGATITPKADPVSDTRFYVYTFVTDRGEESAPSPISIVIEPTQYDSVFIAAPSSVPSGRYISKWRIYRTNTGETTTTFQFVVELNLTDTTTYLGGTVAGYTDTKLAAELGEPCPTTTWAEPPRRAAGTNPYLRNIVAMPNGILAGFIDNYVAFSEPYAPYAWPVEYQIPLKYAIVGLACYGDTLFVGTTDKPYLISGSDSASMSAMELDQSQSCVSRRSLAATQGGVYYASPDGMCFANQSGVQVVTQSLFAREDWQGFLNAGQLDAVWSGGAPADPGSYAFPPAAAQPMLCFTHDGILYMCMVHGVYALDFASGKFNKTSTAYIGAVCDDLNTDAVFYTVAAYAGGEYYLQKFQSGTHATATWTSKTFEVSPQSPLAWLKVVADGPVTVTWNGDGSTVYTVTVNDSTPVRLPAGRYRMQQFGFSSSARIAKAVVTSTTAELQAA